MSISSVCKANGINLNDRRKVSMGGNEWRDISRVTHICRHHSGVNVDQSMQILEGYWKNSHGWNTGGYHIVIHFNGDVDWNYDYGVISNGVGKHNSYTFHISVLGNGKFTPAQEKTFKIICKEAQRELNIPTRNVWGHKEFRGHSDNSCPGINMKVVRKSLESNNAAPGSNVKPDTNLKPTGKTIKVGSQAKQWQTGSNIPKFVIGGVYDVLQEKPVNQSNSKKAYLIGKGKVATGWLLEQDIEGFNKQTISKVESTAKPTGDPVIKGIQANVGEKQDGWDGPDTRKGTRKLFQRAVGTNDDGIIGKNTLNAAPVIRFGSTGWHVYALQAMLYLRGYKNVGIPDKKAGINTIEALAQYQRDNGLTVDREAWKAVYSKIF